MKQLEKLFEQHLHEKSTHIEELPSSGSNRRYFRLTNKNHSLIGVKGTSVGENKAFMAIAKHFYSKGLPVPKVYNHSSDFMFYLQEDLGDEILFKATEKGRLCGSFDKMSENCFAMPSISCRLFNLSELKVWISPLLPTTRMMNE